LRCRSPPVEEVDHSLAASAGGALFTIRDDPSFTPSGANTELQDWAKLLRNVPPQYSPLALLRKRPPTLNACRP
jgi:hypothetical protein